MCGQFELPGRAFDGWLTQIERRYGGTAALSACRRAGTARPGEILPVLARGRSGQTGAFLMRWGFRMNESGPLLINARSETAAKKPTFADEWQRRRCLIPAAHYYEWQRAGGKERQKFALKPTAPGEYYLAGLYRYEKDGRMPSFVVLTRAAEPDIAFIHSRMPVLLTGEAAKEWLEAQGDPSAALHQAVRILDAIQTEEPRG